MAKKIYERRFTYQLTKDVSDAIELIMKEEGYNTMTSALNACILERKRLKDALREEEAASNKLQREKNAIEHEMTSFVRFLDYVQKHTKNI
jgi:hypothetical protein